MRLVPFYPNNEYRIIQRKYVVAEFRFSDFLENDREKLKQEAAFLSNNVNNRAANSGDRRSSENLLNDAIAGLLAEYATMYLINLCDLGNAFRPKSDSSYDQIDIIWEQEHATYTIEVRSSFVRNGIDFALYAVDKNTKLPYFDILGPYYQDSYKPTYEEIRDFYSRVLFKGDNKNVMDRFINNDEEFYLIGFYPGKAMITLDYHKKLFPGSAFTKAGNLSGDYYVSPIVNIMDIDTVIDLFQERQD